MCVCVCVRACVRDCVCVCERVLMGDRIGLDWCSDGFVSMCRG